MKITKEILKKMIIQEITGVGPGVSDIINNQDAYRLAAGAGGEEMMRTDFRTTNFEEDIKRITGLLGDMENIVREDKNLEDSDLQYFKTHHLDNLYRKIGFLEGAIDARLSGKFNDSE